MVIHMGAISSTTFTDGVEINDVNISLSKMLFNYCESRSRVFIYASSASIYGDGSQGFSDTTEIAQHLKYKPLNLYA